MPATDDQQIPITTPQQTHQQTAQNISQNLSQILGSDQATTEMVMAHTPEEKSPEMEQFQEMTNRIFLDKPGYEPSKSFLKKMWERMKKKHPDAVVTLKED